MAYGSPFSSPRMAVIGQPWTPAVKTLILANAAVFLLQILAKPWIGLDWAGLQVPDFFTKMRVWQIFTYLFLHADFWHLAFNMFAVWMFGCEVEQQFGTERFYFYYFLTGMGAGLGVACLGTLAGEHSVTVGASGAVFGILLAYGMFFAERSLTLLLFFVLPVTVKARTLVWIFGAFEFIGGVGQAFGKISHLAHLSGLAAGFIFFLVAYPGLAGKFLNRPRRAARPKPEAPRSSSLPPNSLEAEVDRILEKISRRGMGALSQRERDTLSEAARRSRPHSWPGEN